MKRSITALFFCLLVGSSYGQYSMDFGLALGGANYLGEIGGDGEEARPFIFDMKLAQTNISVGGFYRYNFTRSIAARLAVNYARISGADSLSTNLPRVGRNLSFRTDLIEATLMGEYTFYSVYDVSRASRVDFQSSVYAGIGYLFYYPYAYSDGSENNGVRVNEGWYYLRPLMTEGTENAYEETSLIVPLGINASFTFAKKIKLGIDIGYRFTFTDYLDDVSTDFAYDAELPFKESVYFSDRHTEAYDRGDISSDDVHPGHYSPTSIRGNPDDNDGYLLFQANISYVINMGSSFTRSRYNSIINRRRKRTKF
jgi:hypothetical protein